MTNQFSEEDPMFLNNMTVLEYYGVCVVYCVCVCVREGQRLRACMCVLMCVGACVQVLV